MNNAYILRIDTDYENYETLTSLLGVTPTSTRSFWEYSIEESSHLYINAIDHFLDLIEKNFDKLEKNKISKENLSIWCLYEYEKQCNIEFDPKQLKRLGDAEVSLCISCWEKIVL